MKKITLCCLIPFSDLEQLNTRSYKSTLIALSKKIGKICIVNTECLKHRKLKKKIYSLKDKNFKLINLKSYKQFDKFIIGKNIVLLNSLPRNFLNLRLLFYLNSKKIPQIELSNLGNVQKGTELFIGRYDYKFLKLVFSKHIPKKIINFLSAFGFLSKVDCRFISNKKNYEYFKKVSSFKKFFSYYKNVEFVKSNMYEFKNNKKISEDYIVLLDVYPLYEQMKIYKSISPEEIKEHYKKLNIFLNYLKKIFKKKIAVCIHPKYPKKFYKKYLPEQKVYKFKTPEFIHKAFVVLTYNSSAIMTAIKLNKKIISVEADIYKGKKYSSSVYQEVLGTKTVRITNEYYFNKKKLLSELNKNIKKYKNYKINHLGIGLKNNASDDIFNYIINHYS